MGQKVAQWFLVGAAVSLMVVGSASADVVIKVRALNPLNTTEPAVINYPLPKEIHEENILNQVITYSGNHSEDENPPQTTFNISYNEDEGYYYIDDEVTLLPKEVVTLAVHVEDVWVIERTQIEKMRNEVDNLLKAWEGELPGEGEEEEKTKEEETKEFAIMMKNEILTGLDTIIDRQEKNKIINVGVERHITGYEDNMDDLRQIQQDIVLLANLIQYDASGEEEATEESMDEQPADAQEATGEAAEQTQAVGQ